MFEQAGCDWRAAALPTAPNGQESAHTRPTAVWLAAASGYGRGQEWMAASWLPPGQRKLCGGGDGIDGLHPFDVDGLGHRRFGVDYTGGGEECSAATAADVAGAMQPAESCGLMRRLIPV